MIPIASNFHDTYMIDQRVSQYIIILRELRKRQALPLDRHLRILHNDGDGVDCVKCKNVQGDISEVIYFQFCSVDE